MNWYRLAWRNIADSGFRSWVIALCALLVAGFAVSGMLVVGGVEASLRRVLGRLGADIMVLPAGGQTRAEQAVLMGASGSLRMSRAVVPAIAAVPGVGVATPQLFLMTMRNQSCCSVSDMFMIAFDPSTDFTVRPWLERNLRNGLAQGESVGGQYVFVPEGEKKIRVYGYELDLKGNLEPTGSGLDHSMFFTFDTALEIARRSKYDAERALILAPDSISAVLVKVAPGQDVGQTAAEIERRIPGVVAVESGRLFGTQRRQVGGLLRSAALLSGSSWAVSIALIALVTSMAAAERRRETGVLRALGATRGAVMRSLLAEGLMLAIAGGLLGVALGSGVVSLYRDLLGEWFNVPLLFPSAGALAAPALGGLGLALVGAGVPILLVAWKASRAEPGTAMKE